MSRIADRVRAIALPIVDKSELELVDIEYVKEGPDWFLRVIIDKDGGVDLEDCSLISEQLSKRLDEEDPVPDNYILEVSSSGAERPLKTSEDIINAIGKNIHLKTYAPIEGEKVFEGELLDFADNKVILEIRIKTRKKQVEIPYDMVANARLAVTFN